MFKIILDQIAFKKINMSEYDKLSSSGVWVLFLLVSVASSYITGASLGFWALNAIFGALTMYACGYRFIAFWFKKRGLWDGNGNILGMMITSGAICILYLPAMIIHPDLWLLILIPAVAIGVNAYKHALNISISQVLIAWLVSFVIMVIAIIPLMILMQIIAPVLGIEVPAEMAI